MSRWSIVVYTMMMSLVVACSDAGSIANPLDAEPTATNLGRSAIASPAQPIANQLAKATALAMRDPELRLQIRDAMRDSRFHEHKLHLRSFLEGSDGELLLRGIADALQLPAAAVQQRLDRLPDMEFYLPNKQHRLEWTGGAEYYVLAVEEPNDFENPYATLYRPNGDSIVVDVVNDMPKEPVFAILPVEADFSRPDVPPRAYRGAAVQSREECHPLALGCTRNGVQSAELLTAQLANISDTTGYLYRFWLPRDRDGIGSNEIEMWYWVEGTAESPGDSWPGDVGTPCYRFTGVDVGQWYVLNRSLGERHPRSATPSTSDLGSFFQEDDSGACENTISDDLIGFTDGRSQPEGGTSWDELYPTLNNQEIFYFENGVKKVEGYVSFTAAVNYELAVSISGPNTVDNGQNGTWTANVFNGVGPYTYNWQKDGVAVGTNSTYSTTGYGEDFVLSVTVYDQATGANAFDNFAVLGGGCPPPQIICE